MWSIATGTYSQPYFQQRSRIVPFLAYVGILAADAETASLLESEARTIGDELGVDFIEFRNRDEAQQDWPTKPHHVTFHKEIPDSFDECLKMIPRKQRAMIRKGIGRGHESRVEDVPENFYPILSENCQNLGTPVFARKYFDAIRQAFGPDCEVMTIFKDRTAGASVMSYYFGDEVIPYLRRQSTHCTQLHGE